MNKKILQRPRLIKQALAALVPVAFAHTANGVVTAHFEEIAGPSVVVSWVGTLAIDPNAGNGVGTDDIGIAAQILTNAAFGLDGNPFPFLSGNAGTPAGVAMNPGFNGVPTATVGSFGFLATQLAYTDSYITAGTVGAPTELTVSAATATFTIPGQSLASLGVDSIAPGTLLWTAGNTGDTIVFSNNAPPVPEPSSLILGSIGILGLLRRRR